MPKSSPRRTSPMRRRSSRASAKSLQTGGRREGWFVRNPFARAPGPLEKRTKAEWQQQQEARRKALDDAERRDRSIIKARGLRRDVLKADMIFRKNGQRLFDLYHDLWKRTSDGFIGEEGKQDWLNIVTEGDFDLNEVRNDLYLPLFETENALYTRGGNGELRMLRAPIGHSGLASSRAPSRALPPTPVEPRRQARDEIVQQTPREVAMSTAVPTKNPSYNARRATTQDPAPVIYSALGPVASNNSAGKRPQTRRLAKTESQNPLADFLPGLSINTSNNKPDTKATNRPKQSIRAPPAQRTTTHDNVMNTLRKRIPQRREALGESANNDEWR